jgi:hypothetical protein
MGHAPKLSLRWFVSPDPSKGFGFGNILKRQASIREKLIADCVGTDEETHKASELRAQSSPPLWWPK